MNSNGIQVLLVEDNIDDAELTTRALTKSKLVTNLKHVKDGAEAIDFMFGNKQISVDQQPKLILLDLNMPKISGMDVLQKLKSDERTKRIPVVVLTSSKEPTDLEQCYLLGANSYIVKPVEYQDFMEVVTQIGSYWLLKNQQ